eukprot:PhF_6_TR30575/c1_g1_i4/m.44938
MGCVSSNEVKTHSEKLEIPTMLEFVPALDTSSCGSLSVVSNPDDPVNPLQPPTAPQGLSFGSNTSNNSNSVEPTSTTTPPGALTSKYSRVKQLGSGQYGIVYLVTERLSGRLFAVKVINNSAENDTNTATTEYENLILCRGHPSILQVYETFQSSTKVWLVTEYVSGMPWGSSMFRKGPMPLYPSVMEMLRRILHDLLETLQYMHDEVGMVHMDIKPE